MKSRMPLDGIQREISFENFSPFGKNQGIIAYYTIVGLSVTDKIKDTILPERSIKVIRNGWRGPQPLPVQIVMDIFACNIGNDQLPRIFIDMHVTQMDILFRTTTLIVYHFQQLPLHIKNEHFLCRKTV